MRRTWGGAKAFLLASGWAQEVVRPATDRFPEIKVWRDPAGRVKRDLYLHEAESIQDCRDFLVQHVMTS